MASTNNGKMNGTAPNTDCLMQLLPANDGINADASHREFLEQLRQVKAYPHFPSGDDDISGVFRGIWKRGSVPELQITASLNAWNGSKHRTIKPQVQVVLGSEELKISCKTSFLAVVKVGNAGDGSDLAERLILLSDKGETIHVKGIGFASSTSISIKPFSGCTEDLLKTSILVRLLATSERVTSIAEKQSMLDEMFEELSEKIVSADVVDDLQKLMTKLAGLENSSTDLEGKADRMRTDIDIARDDHRDLSSCVEMHGEQLNELRGVLGAAALAATNTQVTVRNCELALEAERGRLDKVVAENRRLSDLVKALQERAELQDQRIVELRAAAEHHEAAFGHFKMLTYAMLVVVVAFLALIFIY